MDMFNLYMSVVFSFAVARCCLIEIGKPQCRQFFRRTSTIEIVLVNIIKILIAYFLTFMDWAAKSEDAIVFALVIIEVLLIISYILIAYLIYEIWETNINR